MAEKTVTFIKVKFDGKPSVIHNSKGESIVFSVIPGGNGDMACTTDDPKVITVLEKMGYGKVKAKK